MSNQVMITVLHAMERRAATVHCEMRRGINSLATIASIAPWLGLLITVEGIVGSFRGIDGEKSAILAAIASWLSYAIARGALGLAVGIIALWIHRYFESRLETIDTEMYSMSLGVVNALAPLSRGH